MRRDCPVLPHLRTSDKGGKGRRVEREGGREVWVGAPVPPLPQLPIEEHGKRSRPSLFIYNSGSRYSRGTGPGCGRLKRVRKEQHAGPALSDGSPREEKGLNQITLVTLARLLLFTFRRWQKERRGDGRGGTGGRREDRYRQRETKRQNINKRNRSDGGGARCCVTVTCF